MSQLIESGSIDDGAVFTERVDRFRAGDTWIELPVAGLFLVSGGRITLWRDYFDWGPSPPSSPRSAEPGDGPGACRNLAARAAPGNVSRSRWNRRPTEPEPVRRRFHRTCPRRARLDGGRDRVTPEVYGDGMDRPLSALRFAVVDVETSGLLVRRHHVLQVGVVVVDGDGTVAATLEQPGRPRRRWLYRVGPTQIHGITRRQVRAAPPRDRRCCHAARRAASQGTRLVAHNAGVRRRLPAQSAAPRAGVAPAARRCRCAPSPCRASSIPSVGCRHRLGDVAARYGVELLRPHDALADAEATAAVLPHLLRAHGVTTRRSARSGPVRDVPLAAVRTSGGPAPPTVRRLRAAVVGAGGLAELEQLAAVRAARSRQSSGASTSAFGPRRSSSARSHRSPVTGMVTSDVPGAGAAGRRSCSG